MYQHNDNIHADNRDTDYDYHRDKYSFSVWNAIKIDNNQLCVFRKIIWLYCSSWNIETN